MIDPIAAVERALELVRATPARPSPAICRACTYCGVAAGGDPVFTCQSRPGCAIDAALEADARGRR